MEISNTTTVKDNQPKKNTQLEDNSTQAEKTFTQEEVNRIVQDRLAKERSKAERSQQEQDEQIQKELIARENKLACREFIIDNDYPKELLDCIDTSNPEDFKIKAETILGAILGKSRRSTMPTPPFRAAENTSDPFDEVFGRNIKHTPKNY